MCTEQLLHIRYAQDILFHYPALLCIGSTGQHGPHADLAIHAAGHKDIDRRMEIDTGDDVGMRELKMLPGSYIP